MERFSGLKKQEKIAKVFKAVISAGLVTSVFVSVSACEKAEPALEETEITQQIVPETMVTETTTPPETKIQKEILPATEVVEAGPVEWEGITINPIEALRFEEGNLFALGGNPYGLETETKAGVNM